MEYLFIYFLQIFNRITAFYGILLLFTSIMVFIYVFTNGIYLSDKSNYSQEMKTLIDFLKKIIICCISLTVILTFIPTKNTLLLMGGMYLGKKAVNTIVTDEKIKKVDTIINLELDKRINELKKGN